MIIRCLCLLLITGPCVPVMMDFDNFGVMHNYKRIGEISYVSGFTQQSYTTLYLLLLQPVDRFFFYRIYYFLFSILPFSELFFTIECKLSHSIDKLRPLAQVHVILLINVFYFVSYVFWEQFACGVYLAFWDVVFVCVDNDVCEVGVSIVYIWWWFNVRESSIGVCSELCPVCFSIVCQCVFVLL